MIQYHNLLKDVLDNGYDCTDRTGVGTKSVFGRQCRYDLREGFPLLTTKKTHFKSIVHELLWILSGDTNIKYLKDNGVKIWDEWADKDGNLGPIYGKQWRRWDSVLINKIQKFPLPDQSHIKGSVQGIGNLGDSSVYLKKPLHTELYQTWYGMLKRCYNKSHMNYSRYGGAGVFVCERWLTFSNFYMDVQKLPNWLLKLEYPNDFSLDKDFYSSNMYGPETCRWSSSIEQSTNTDYNDNFFEAKDPEGNITYHYGLRPFCDEYSFCKPSVSNVLNNKTKSNYGWTFNKIIVPDGCIARFTRDDQIRRVIADLKHAPTSRRIIINAWNVSELSRMALVPCHSFVQFNVKNGFLSCQLYQRSADLFLGVPFNIASYALLTHMLAQLANLKVGEFIHTLGDAHIYLNHLDQVKELLARDPNKYPLPKLELNSEIKDIDDFKYDDIKLKGYESYPSIKAPVAV